MKQDNLDDAEQKKLTRTAYLIIFCALSIIIHSIIMITFFHCSFHRRALHHIETFIPFIISDEQHNEQNKDMLKQFKHKREKVLDALKSLKKHPENNLPAKLRAPKSNFGWTIFEEPSQETPSRPHKVEVPTTLDGPVGEASTTQATEGKPGPVTTSLAKPPAIATPPIQKAVAEAITPKITPKKPVTATKPMMQPKIAVHAGSRQPLAELPGNTYTSHKEISPEDTGENPEKSVAERIAAIRDLQEKISSFEQGRIPESTTTRPSVPTTQAAREATGPTIEQGARGQPTADRIVGGTGGIRVRGARSIDGKPQRNIIALTKGFVEKLDGEEGTDLIDRDGDPNKRPSFEDLKYLSYEAKINWCLQAAWKQNFCYKPSSRPLQGQAVVEFTIDEHGNVTQSTLLQSTGHAELDAMILKNTKFASPFPPLPHHFETKSYTTGRIINVHYSNTTF